MEMGMKESLVGVRGNLGKLLAVGALGDAAGLDGCPRSPEHPWPIQSGSGVIPAGLGHGQVQDRRKRKVLLPPHCSAQLQMPGKQSRRVELQQVQGLEQERAQGCR